MSTLTPARLVLLRRLMDADGTLMRYQITPEDMEEIPGAEHDWMVKCLIKPYTDGCGVLSSVSITLAGRITLRDAEAAKS